MVIVNGFEIQLFIIGSALGLFVREFVVGAAPFLGESGPVNLCAFYSDCGRDGAGDGVEGLRIPTF